jgi:hypothetical protein
MCFSDHWQRRHLQPFFRLTLSTLLLQETVGWKMIAMTLGVILCVAGAKRFAAPP